MGSTHISFPAELPLPSFLLNCLCIPDTGISFLPSAALESQNLFPRPESSKALCTPTNDGYPSDIYLAISRVSGEGNHFRVKLRGLIGLSSIPALQFVGSINLGELDHIFLCSTLFFLGLESVDQGQSMGLRYE